MPLDAYFRTRMPPDARRAAAWAVLVDYIQRDIPEGAAVLELGAGRCQFINRVRASRRAAVDLSGEVASCAGAGVESYVGACWDLKWFAAGSFDVVFASNLFEHLSWEEFGRTLDESSRVLKSGGLLAHLHPNFRHCFRSYWDDYTHRIALTDLSVADFLSAKGFRVQRVVPRLVPFSVRDAGGFPVRSWMVRWYLASPWRPRAAQMYMVARKP